MEPSLRLGTAVGSNGVVNPNRRFRPAIDVFMAATAAASPRGPLPSISYPDQRTLAVGPHRIDIAGLRDVWIVGAGKAARSLCEAIAFSLGQHRELEDKIRGQLLVPEPLTRSDEALSALVREATLSLLSYGTWTATSVRPRNSNRPTSLAVAATRLVLDRARELGPDDLLICALTGGASALLCAPAEGLSLSEKCIAVDQLASDGATIAEINTLRRHLSAVKGGRLAQAAANARAVVSILISDVDGDDPSVIGSGPCVADPTTYRDAIDLREEWPHGVLRHLQRGVAGEIPDTPDTLPENVASHVVITPSDALFGAYARARDDGWTVVTLPRPTPSNLQLCVDAHLDAMRHAQDGTAILSIGEAPLELPSAAPSGGRAGHLALAIAVAADADPQLRDRFTVLVGATDGEDGSSGTAGGVVDSAVLRAAEAAGADPGRLLQSCESLRALQAGDGCLRGMFASTNVQDLRVILIGRSA
jgi:hydroxypyruvate reductase